MDAAGFHRTPRQELRRCIIGIRHWLNKAHALTQRGRTTSIGQYAAATGYLALVLIPSLNALEADLADEAGLKVDHKRVEAALRADIAALVEENQKLAQKLSELGEANVLEN